MKFKTTKKAINTGYSKKICVGYCNLQYLLSCENPIAYTAVGTGWGADIYAFGDVAIITGYSPFGDIRPSYDICQKYEKMAANEKSAENIRRLIAEFIAEVQR